MLCLSTYAGKLLERSGLSNCNSSATPMEPHLKLSKTSTTAVVDATTYRHIIGSLRYLVHTWPDLAYAMGYLSRFMEELLDDHLMAVKRMLWYVVGTRDYGLHYAKGEEGQALLVGFSEADMAGDVDTWKSTKSIIFFLGGNPITWQLTKQKAVALSSCKAEYIVAATASYQGVWLAQLIGDALSIEY